MTFGENERLPNGPYYRKCSGNMGGSCYLAHLPATQVAQDSLKGTSSKHLLYKDLASLHQLDWPKCIL